MSAGHGHARPNLKHPGELKKLLAQGGAPELMQRWQSLDVEHDMAYLAGYNVGGTVRFLDRDFLHALLDPAYAEHLGIGPIDTGLSPQDTVDCLMQHEGVEKVLLDADNPIDVYLPAHELATVAEHEMVRQKGGQPGKYERGLKKAIEWCAKKKLHRVPQDFACAPMLDDPDANEHRIIVTLQHLGVVDAFKLSKSSVDYGSSTGEDQCAGCAHWQQDRGQELSTCEDVDGLVRNTHWCRRYLAMEQADGEQAQELQAGGPQGEAPRRTPHPEGSEDTGEAPGGGNPLGQF